ncbi:MULTISPECIES: hypothetical protein [unclassified Streptomyces]|uniref:zinc finger domain-containing protein n=1 Tax=unclassified Streptomyces TaxID=2593676 RepID=UPI003823B2C8
MTDSETSPSVRIPPPLLKVDGGGVLTVQATPEWFQHMAHAPEWTEFAEQLAAAGKAAVNPRLCLSTETQTGHPCRWNTQQEPCVHHGPKNNENRCGAPTKSGDPCRWNLIVHGPCRNHPDTYERILEEKRAQEAELRRHQEAEEAERARRFEERSRAAQQLPCPYCAAEPGAACINPKSRLTAARNHSLRFNLLDHTQAAVIPCQSCGAPAGDLCRTSTGKLAAEAHVPRRWTN